MNIEITKDYEGKVVYGIPTGNNATRGVSRQKPKEFIVIKRKTKYVELQVVGYKYTDMYDPVTGATQKDINSGYIGNAGYYFYDSLEAIEEEYILNQKKVKILSYFRGFGSLRNTSKEDIEAIYNIIFKDENSIKG